MDVAFTAAVTLDDYENRTSVSIDLGSTSVLTEVFNNPLV
jgi:hypothetical protein